MRYKFVMIFAYGYLYLTFKTHQTRFKAKYESKHLDPGFQRIGSENIQRALHRRSQRWRAFLVTRFRAPGILGTRRHGNANIVQGRGSAKYAITYTHRF